MKAYTDILQSKKLAEILPVESADMSWCNSSVKGVNYTDEYSVHIHTVKEMQECFNETFNGWDKYWKLIPCWSLAALINYLPLEFSINKQTDGVDTYCYIASCDCRKRDIYTHRHINLVDACVEMLLKLNELKLL